MDNKTLTVYAWDMSLDAVERLITSGKYSHINFYFYHEYEVSIGKKTIDFINQNRITIDAVTCLMFKSDLKRVLWAQGIDPVLLKKIDVWNSVYLDLAYTTLLQDNGYLNKNYENKNFKYPFLSFNGVFKDHRSAFVDSLAKHDLINKGIVTYHQISNFDKTYDWKYHDGSIITTDDNFENHHSSYLFSNTFLESFLHIPTETVVNIPILTEKTAIPLLNKLPFLVLGSQNLHRKLNELYGFKLYNEIFDYSFDQFNLLEDRIDGIVKNIKYVVTQKDNLNELYKSIESKVEFNRKRAIEIIHDYNSVPVQLRSHINKLTNHNKKLVDGDAELLQNTQRFKGLKLADSEIFVNQKKIIGEYSVWNDPRGFSYERIVDDIKRYDYDSIKILSEHEWEIWFTEEFISEIKQRNIHVDITVLGNEGDWYTNYFKKHKLKNYVTIHHWPTFFFNYTNMILEEGSYKKELKIKNIEFPFLCLNGRGLDHRARMIDELAKLNLLNKGKFSWHDPNDENELKFKYYDGKKVSLDENYKTAPDQYQIPKEFENCLFHLVTESTVDVILLSEKTGMPIYYKKPFIVLGGQGINQKLRDLGFDLFDEYIDYSFDKEPDYKKRIEMIAKEIEKISKLDNLTEMYKSMMPKLEHNYQVFKHIIADISLIPQPNMEVFHIVTPIDNYQDYKHHYLLLKGFLNDS